MPELPVATILPLLGSNYDEQIKVVDKAGKAMQNVPYYISDVTGKSYKGFTDENGCTPRIYTENEEQLTVYLGLAALEEWEKNNG